MTMHYSHPESGHCRLRLRRKLGRLLVAVATLCFFMVVAERDACAYTDPGSGALMWQLLLAAMVGVSFYFRKFIGWIRNWRKGPQEDETADEDA